MGQILYNIFITPIEYFIEIVFTVMNLAFDNQGIAIIFVSIAVQLLCFPLYKRADDIQEQERKKQKEMERWVTHIKKTFKGDERFMMQQAYYKEVGYKPIYAIKGSLSLLLQIPFFIAAYNFLSKLELLKGASFLGIPDLSMPDGLIKIGDVSINLLPVLMTLFNIISGIIYTKGFPLKDKIQTYGLAAIFLVILYQSPSGLVFYWTLNNLFSLLKNVFMKVIRHPKEVINTLLLIVGIAASIYFVFLKEGLLYVKIAVLLFSVICILPTVYYFYKKSGKKISLPFDFKDLNKKQINTIFYFSSAVLVLLLGLLIPIDVIKTSPVEFVGKTLSPAGLIINTFSIYVGLILVWIGIFYIFSPLSIRKVFSVISSILAAAGLTDYLFFAKKLGTMSTLFVYDKYPVFNIQEILINVAVFCGISLLIFILYIKKAELVKRLNQILCLTLSVMIVIGSVSIKKTLDFELGTNDKNKTEQVGFDKIINLSKNGKNVIVFMLDRAISGYLPFIIEEKPEIKELFDGFTYYPNTISFGGCTNFAAPALFGGYEYTPDEINKRKDETLKDKHDEAITMLPKLFSDNGYSVSVIDPPYAGYKWISDLSIYDEYENVKASVATGKYSSNEMDYYSGLFESIQKRNAVFYSLMKGLPVVTQNILYQDGDYFSSAPYFSPFTTFFNEYSVLKYLSKLTDISNDSQNTFTMMQNAATHEPVTFDENYSMPANKAVSPLAERKNADGTVMELTERTQIMHYVTNVAALLRVGEWFSYLKEQGVYDNTRIILVADHGKDLAQFNKTNIVDGIDIQSYNPLLLVKDFNAHGFTTSDEFMTNADTPVLAVDGVIKNPVNPFTGKIIDSSEKTAHPQMISTSQNFDVSPKMGNQLDTSNSEWWSVEDNIFDAKNWKKVGESK